MNTKHFLLWTLSIMLISSCASLPAPSNSNDLTTSNPTTSVESSENSSNYESETTTVVPPTEVTLPSDSTSSSTDTPIPPTEITSGGTSETTTNPQTKVARIDFSDCGSGTDLDAAYTNATNVKVINIENEGYVNRENTHVRLGSGSRNGSVKFYFDQELNISNLKITGYLYKSSETCDLKVDLNGYETSKNITSATSTSFVLLTSTAITSDFLKIYNTSGNQRYLLESIEFTIDGTPGEDITTTPTTDPTSSSSSTTTSTTPSTDPVTTTTASEGEGRYGYLFDNDIIKPSRGSKLGSVDSYYESCRGLKGTALKNELTRIVNDGKKTFSYNSIKESQMDTDEDPYDSSYYILVYTGERLKKSSFSGWTYTNREHIWPQSLLNSDAQKSDKHMVRPSEQKINSRRGNLPFGVVDDKSSANHLGTKNSIDEGNYCDNTYFEPKDDFKGDVARMVFYMAICYDSLELSTSGVDTTKFNTYSGTDSLGDFTDLYNWAMSNVDPVSDFEMNKNNKVDELYQNNRNPFIDHPEFIEMIYNKNYNGKGALLDY